MTLITVASLQQGRAEPLDIKPMTHVDVDAHAGYMSDPYPIRRAPFVTHSVQLLSGTTPNILACEYPISARCFASFAVSIDSSWVMPQLESSGMMFHGLQNRDIFQDNDGSWHMAVGVDFGPDKAINRTVIAHASPDGDERPDEVPTHWSIDEILIGSFSVLEQGNYDCKYLRDKGRLYLLYVKNLRLEPLVNGIVIQPMLTPTQLARGEPTLLLSPKEDGGGFSSEVFTGTTARLVEAANIQVINGKYAMAYSTGSYLTAGYKAGVAWSDTLIPAPGREYRKVLENDVHDVWRNQSQTDVRYLIQSQQIDWPDYTGGEVEGPGVSSFVQGPYGAWHMFFNAYAPDDMPASAGVVEASRRRPYFVRLRVDVPAHESVAAASDAELARWIVPERREAPAASTDR